MFEIGPNLTTAIGYAVSGVCVLVFLFHRFKRF